jgi:hypothetical protein
MAREVFYSFHHRPDSWRAAQVRNAGVIEGNQPVSDNDWEVIKRGGDTAIKAWIDAQLAGKSCAVVLIGTNTSERRYVKYEIQRAWDSGKGLVGIYVHNLKDAAGLQSNRGRNPFAAFTINSGRTNLGDVVRAYDPPYTISTSVYEHIRNNLASWVEEAILIRTRN